MKTDSRNLASKVEAVIREYTDARINEELAPLRDDIATLKDAILRLRENLQSDLGNVTGRMTSMETLVNMSTSRLAKLKEIAKEVK